jgi:hypothetical protein
VNKTPSGYLIFSIVSLLGVLIWLYFGELATSAKYSPMYYSDRKIHLAFTTALLGVITAIFLYFVRENVRILYGVFEVGLSAAILFYFSFDDVVLDLTLAKSNHDPLKVYNSWTFAGAIYVFIRGLDNVHQGLVELKKEAIWRRIFHFSPVSGFQAGLSLAAVILTFLIIFFGFIRYGYFYRIFG